VVIIVGSVTAFSPTVGLVQNDIKPSSPIRLFAVGYMFVAMGVGAYGAGISICSPRLLQALLFLGSGSVIHAMSDEQDIPRWAALPPYPRHLAGDADRHPVADRFFPIPRASSPRMRSSNPLSLAAGAAHFAFVLLVVAASAPPSTRGA